jgi:hypothetical protein
MTKISDLHRVGAKTPTTGARTTHSVRSSTSRGHWWAKTDQAVRESARGADFEAQWLRKP